VIIINADDYGVDIPTNDAVAELHSMGVIDRASIMPNGNAFEEAKLLSVPCGLHIALSNGKGSRLRSLSGICGGYLPERWVILSQADARAEVEVQVGAVDMAKMLHIDSHIWCIPGHDNRFHDLLNWLYSVKRPPFVEFRRGTLPRNVGTNYISGAGKTPGRDAFEKIRTLAGCKKKIVWIPTHVSSDRKNARRYTEYMALKSNATKIIDLKGA
jgi:hypothetical protein